MIYSENASYWHSIFLAKIQKKVIAVTHMRKSLIKGIEYTAHQAITCFLIIVRQEVKV